VLFDTGWALRMASDLEKHAAALGLNWNIHKKSVVAAFVVPLTRQ